MEHTFWRRIVVLGFQLFTKILNTKIHHNLSSAKQPATCFLDSEIRDYIQERVKEDNTY